MSSEDSDETIEERVRKKEYIFDVTRRKRIKRSEDLKVFDDVFNKRISMTIYSMMSRGIIAELHGAIASGKESKVFYGVGENQRELAVKIYLVSNRELRRSMKQYIEGDPRFKDIPTRSWELIKIWARKEFVNLHDLWSFGLRVPRPYHLEQNILVMEFIGKEGKRAELLKESDMRVGEYKTLYQKVLDFMSVSTRRASLVHGDLSEYNIMVYDGELVFFDVSQTVSVKHPMAGYLFKRDFENIKAFFSLHGVRTIDLGDFLESVGGVGFDVS